MKITTPFLLFSLFVFTHAYPTNPEPISTYQRKNVCFNLATVHVRLTQLTRATANDMERNLLNANLGEIRALLAPLPDRLQCPAQHTQLFCTALAKLTSGVNAMIITTKSLRMSNSEKKDLVISQVDSWRSMVAVTEKGVDCANVDLEEFVMMREYVSKGSG